MFIFVLNQGAAKLSYKTYIVKVVEGFEGLLQDSLFGLKVRPLVRSFFVSQCALLMVQNVPRQWQKK